MPLFLRLQKLPLPLVDTLVTAIERLLSSYEAQTEHARAIAGLPESSKGCRSQPWPREWAGGLVIRR
jgi:hypothetical protein